MRKSLDAGEVDQDNERRSASGSIVAVGEARGIPGNAQTDDEERSEINDGDTPESALDSSGEGLARVGSLGRRESDELGSGCEDEESAYEDPLEDKQTHQKRRQQ